MITLIIIIIIIINYKRKNSVDLHNKFLLTCYAALSENREDRKHIWLLEPLPR